jgi:hypothetical protein
MHYKYILLRKATRWISLSAARVRNLKREGGTPIRNSARLQEFGRDPNN